MKADFDEFKEKVKLRTSGDWMVTEEKENGITLFREVDGYTNIYTLEAELTQIMKEKIPETKLVYQMKVTGKNENIQESYTLLYHYGQKLLATKITVDIGNKVRLLAKTNNTSTDWRLDVSFHGEKTDFIQELFKEEIKKTKKYRLYFVFE